MKIAIVGAGFTGCLLAKFLGSHKFEVSVFEKSRGCGGRASTKQTTWGQFDLGATIVPAQKSSFVEFMQGLSDSDIVAKWPENVFLLQPNTDNNHLLERYISDRQYYVFTHKMNAACRHWIKNAKLHINSLISQVRYFKGKGWQLKINDIWQSEYFDKVVLTAPWPQSKILIEKSKISIPVSDLTQSWTSCWSVALKLEQLVEYGVDLVYLKDQAIQTLVRDSNKPLRPQVATLQTESKSEIWVAQLANKHSDDLGEFGKEEATSIAIKGLCELFNIPEKSVSNHYAHYWKYARPSPSQSSLGMLSQPMEGFYTAGDWSYGASIESSYEAALRLSQTIIKGE
jgi:predicted NAD/FAD-dependent oxidoreductase